MNILLQTPTARVIHYPQDNLLELVFDGFVSGAALREPYDFATQQARRLGVRRWLTNNQRMRAVRQADQEWLMTDWAPRYNTTLQLAGTAVVDSEDAMNQLYTDQVVPAAAAGRAWPTRRFTTREAARQWLLTL